MTGESGNRRPASYRLYRLYRLQVLVTFAIFGATAPVALSASPGDRDGPPLLFALAWIAVLCWNAYWFLLRLCYRLDLEDGILRWWAPLRSGHAPLTGLRALRPARLGPNVAVLEFVDGPHVLVLAGRGFAEFAARVQATAPQAVVRTSWYIRLTKRLPGSGRFRG
jgi:hypothetical protein